MHLFQSLLEARWGTELTVSGSSAAIHPEVQKVTPECEACRLMEAATENGPHSRGPLSIVAVLTPTSEGHQNRFYLFMTTSRKCMSARF